MALTSTAAKRGLGTSRVGTEAVFKGGFDSSGSLVKKSVSQKGELFFILVFNICWWLGGNIILFFFYVLSSGIHILS